jgi:hypothetical protein
LIGLFRSLNGPVVWMRPVQVFYLALLYRVFELNPLGYHIVNHLVFLAGILLLYGVLRKINLPRILSISIPFLFAMLPHYSTDRFWPILFCANLSMTAYFLSLFADLRMLDESGIRLWLWKTIGILSLLIGLLAYEIFLPLLLLNFILVWARNRNHHGPRFSGAKITLLMATNLIAAAAVVLFKALVTTRMIMQGPADHLVWFLKMLARAFQISFVKYGLQLPQVIKSILIHHQDWKTITVSIVIALLAYIYLARIRKESPSPLQRAGMMRMVAFGFLLFFLGYAIFLTNENADPSAAGLNNRTALAATVGVAFTFTAAAGWISSYLRTERLRMKVFAALIAILCAAHVLITNTIATFWVQAYSKEQAVLSDIRKHVPTIQSNTTLILDGVCPYNGPAIIFESNWDLAGALKLYYRDPTLEADVVKPTIKITNAGLQTVLYGAVSTIPYRNLWIYSFSRKEARMVHNADEAKNYFQEYNPYFGLECPDSKEGEGVPIF